MALEMRKFCEACERSISIEADAYICTYECTFCEPCTENMKYICPNCGGELVKRPKPR
ncbi:DUF1272 domain-containing protein [Evansella cellulosilytica]|uniref:DUF1272 domain-containing protein n=1 Tax=Evansella cellulosilytica (strain ATCC 21833 / DSM 2522 / FERM P-1141 / JCM 9156 / N-4) TaxID=649639 RepID=E6TQF2_EVAC2|nr:DUF1272 domain-containing protein [Evansella cellulosilytica]ADU29330.1 protein of unknown function DUF1272 [Evansella cellulosilytica DSM 2522]